MKCNNCNKNVDNATGLYCTVYYGSICDSCYNQFSYLSKEKIGKNGIMIHRPQDDDTVLIDQTDNKILITKFCNRWHNPKKAFKDYFERYLLIWFKNEHKNHEYYKLGKWWIYDHDFTYIYFKWNISNSKGDKWTYDLPISYHNLCDFIINLETKWKINNILFSREQETLKPKIQQRSLF